MIASYQVDGTITLTLKGRFLVTSRSDGGIAVEPLAEPAMKSVPGSVLGGKNRANGAHRIGGRFVKREEAAPAEVATFPASDSST